MEEDAENFIDLVELTFCHDIYVLRTLRSQPLCKKVDGAYVTFLV